MRSSTERLGVRRAEYEGASPDRESVRESRAEPGAGDSPEPRMTPALPLHPTPARDPEAPAQGDALPRDESPPAWLTGLARSFVPALLGAGGALALMLALMPLAL